MEKEANKIPLICKHNANTCLFDVRQCNSKMYWDWLQENKEYCPKVCPKYKGR